MFFFQKLALSLLSFPLPPGLSYPYLNLRVFLCSQTVKYLKLYLNIICSFFWRDIFGEVIFKVTALRFKQYVRQEMSLGVST